MSVIRKDFIPLNSWAPDRNGENWPFTDEPKYLVDQSTGRRYFNESKSVVGFKCLLLTLGTPFVHGLAGIANIAYRSMKLLTLYHFWAPNDKKEPYSFAARLKDAGMDLLKIAAQPISYIGLELAAVFGLFMPYDGRKLYASIERAQYGCFILAPCFQPDPEKHLLGGNMDQKNAF